ncbi:MAG: ABC transporter ATP-binding protein [Parasphingorhabdus sp.]|nr:ABC transporter ATP-binding protein [Parasphingorhabdus sp.]
MPHILPSTNYRMLLSSSTMAIIMFAASAAPIAAQTVADTGNSGYDSSDNEIIVSATRIRGSVTTDLAPVLELDEAAIASYGAASIIDLVSDLSTATGSARGRGGGQPVVLVNGQRVSGFREIRNLPPEAVLRVQIFPEELALQYGYRADQRVINFILKDDYTSFDAELEYGVPTRGGLGKSEIESTFTKIGKNSRLNLDVEYQDTTTLTEAERGVIQSPISPDADNAAFRTLIAPTQQLQLNGTYSRSFDNGANISLNAAYTLAETRALKGLPGALLTDPAGNTALRLFTGLEPIAGDDKTDTLQFGATAGGNIAKWRWTLTADYTRGLTNTLTDQTGDVAVLQAAAANGNIGLFDPIPAALIPVSTQDSARALSSTLNTLATLSGTLAESDAGPVTATISGGYNQQSLDTDSISGNVPASANLNRDNVNSAVNLNIPLLDPRGPSGSPVGEFSVNGNVGYSELSDFGGLGEFGFGLVWKPFRSLTLTASMIGDEAAPSIQQLGNPLIITPSVPTFDFRNGISVLASITTGGNRALLSERQRDIKLSATYEPQWLDGMTFLAEYFRNNSKNVASPFPLLTPEIEAAFPERVTRDTNGRLLAIDQRPVNFAQVTAKRIRFGFDFSKRFGRPQRSEGQGQGGGGRGGADRGGGGSTPGLPGRDGGRWQVSLYDTIELESRILIRPGVTELDLLGGSATGSSGGTPRHTINLDGGWFNNGIGMRFFGKYQSATTVDGATAAGNLRFGDLATVNYRLFVNLDQRGNLTKKMPFLKGSRIALRIDNLFDDIQDVRDANGLVPLRYQPGLIDPLGRYVELSFRKRF